jgi:2-amino-4-hydroxy-6-hydroxymethyldihydropteridine diphosphokinase
VTAVYLALGSNLGDRRANLRAALAALEEAGVRILLRSFAWETPPVPADQPPFLNAAALAETALPPPDLLALLKQIEHALGRRPGRRWGPRPIDIDILFYGDLELETPDLVIPHPRIAERAFVLAPLSEVAEGPLPVLGETALQLLARTGLQGARRAGEL